jgi:hypothetical protein
MFRAELREANIEALGMQGMRDMADALTQGVEPSSILVDGMELKDATARRVLKDLARTVPILIVDSRTEPAPDLPGAEILWRPLRVQDVVSRVLEKLGREGA